MGIRRVASPAVRGARPVGPYNNGGMLMTTSVGALPAGRRRPFILEPGQHLLLEVDPIRVMTNCARFGRQTGIPARGLKMCRLAALPIPIGTVRDWPDVRPEMLWLPLLWLPPKLAEPQHFAVEGGLAHLVDSSDTTAVGVSVESDEEWILRVCLELTAAGAYDPKSGTFLDVMDCIGIDLETTRDHKRVAAWLDGASDEVIDQFASGQLLAGHIAGEVEPDWALNEALANCAHYVSCAHAFGAESLADSLDELKDALDAGQASLEDATSFLLQVCIAAAMWMEDMPLQDVADGEVSEGSWWLECHEDVCHYAGSLEQFVADCLEPAIERLSGISDAVMPLTEQYLAK